MERKSKGQTSLPSGRLVIAENNVDTIARFNFKLKMYYEFQGKCRGRLSFMAQRFKNYFFGDEQS